MAPADRAGLEIDRFQHSLAPHIVVRTCPTIDSVGWLCEVDAPARMGIDDKQAILRIETWRAVVRQSAFIGCDDAPVRCGLFCGIWNRPSLLVDAERPVHRTIGSREKTLAIGAIEDEE